jgi:hypothetical protein
VEVPSAPGRTDATQEQTDVDAFAVLEPVADGFRNYQQAKYSVSAEELLVDKVQFLALTAPEMTVLVGGTRLLNANVGRSQHGVFTKRPETLTNDFFINVLDMRTQWKATSEDRDTFDGCDRPSGRAEVDRHPRRPDLRLELPAPRDCRGLWTGRCEGAVCDGLRDGLDRAHERGSLRRRLILDEGVTCVDHQTSRAKHPASQAVIRARFARSSANLACLCSNQPRRAGSRGAMG